MDIFVWKSHGDVEVYEIKTKEQLTKIIKDISGCLMDWTGELITDLRGYIEKMLDQDLTVQQLRGLLNYSLAEIEVGWSDLFESGTGITTLK